MITYQYHAYQVQARNACDESALSASDSGHTAANTAAKLVSDGVVAVIGHVCSGATNAALPIYVESDILAISPSATNPDLRDFPNFFRTIGADDAQGPAQVAYVVDVLGMTKIAILHDKGDYGKGLADFALASLAERGIEPVLFDGITVGAVDYSAIINRVAAEGAEIVLSGGYHPDACTEVRSD